MSRSKTILALVGLVLAVGSSASAEDAAVVARRSFAACFKAASDEHGQREKEPAVANFDRTVCACLAGAGMIGTIPDVQVTDKILADVTRVCTDIGNAATK